MSSVDNRIVSMTFDNENFERKLAATMGSLDKLTEALNFASSKNALADLSEQAGKFDLSNMGAAVENISSKFSVLGAVGFTVIQEITRAAMDMAGRVANLVVDPLVGGGKRRAENIEQAKFMFRGLGIDIEKGMQSALDAVRGTAYGLDVAAKTAAQFGASGMETGEQMTGALRAVAGLAAMTNTSFEEMASVFTSAAGNGRVMSNELGRISHRGVNAAAALAKEWGITELEVKKMASEGQISFEMFAEAMDSAFGEHATKANETYAGSLANMRAALARVGASFFGPRLEQQRDLFNALTPAIDKVHDALKPLIYTFTKMTGLSTEKLARSIRLLDFSNLEMAIPDISVGVFNVYKAFGKLLKTIKEAYREIFPKSETSNLVKFADAFKDFSEKLKIGGETASKIRSVFKGIFSAIAIGWEIIKETTKLFLDLFSSLAGMTGLSSGGVLDFFANMGEKLTELKTKLVDGGGIVKFFEKVREAIKDPITFLKDLKDRIVEFFKGNKITDGVSLPFDRLKQRFDSLKDAAKGLSGMWDWLSNALGPIGTVLGKIFVYIKDWFKELGQKLADSMNEGDFSAVMDALNVSLLGGIALILGNFLKNGINVDFGGGMLAGITDSLGGLTGVLEAMQTNIKAEALLKIAGAVGLLTASVVVLSLIDSAALTKSLTAMTVGFGQLLGSMQLLSQISVGPMGAAKMTMLAGGMVILAGAILILSAAVKTLSGLDWNELAKGLTGVGALLAAISAASIPLSKNSGGLIRAGLGMIGISIAINILGKAVAIFATMTWTELAKGLTGVAVGLGAITTATALMPKGMVAKGVGVIAIAIALNILAKAVQSFATMSWTDMAKGLVGVAGGLIAIALAMKLMPKSIILTGPGLLLISIGLIAMAKAVTMMSKLSWEDLGKGIAGLAGTLLVLAAATKIMSSSILGAVTIGILAVSLMVLAKAIEHYASLSIAELAGGLGALAASLLVLAGLSALLSPLVLVMMGLGAAMLLLGAGFALFGVGAMGVAAAFGILAAAGTAGVGILMMILDGLIERLPDFIAAFANGLVELAQIFLDAAPVLVKSLGVLVSHILETVVKLAPEFGEALKALIETGLDVLRSKFPDVVETAFELLMALLNGIKDNIGEVAKTAIDIILEFINAIASKLGEITAAAANLLVEFLKGISNNLSDVIAAGFEIIVKIIEGIGDGLADIVTAAAGALVAFLDAIGDGATDIVIAGFGIIVKIIEGIEHGMSAIVRAAADAVTAFLGELLNSIQQVIQAGWDFIIGFINGLADSIEHNLPELKAAGKRLAGAIADGFIGGMGEKAGSMVSAVTGPVSSGISKVGGLLRLGSPSRVFRDIGINVAKGFSNGVHSGGSDIENSIKTVGSRSIKTFKKVLSKLPDTLDTMPDFNPVISPVLDLTDLRTAARSISTIVGTNPALSTNLTFGHAQAISASSRAIQETSTLDAIETGQRVINFEQNNYSPEALSVADIYRQTRNQIALVKEELAIP